MKKSVLLFVASAMALMASAQDKPKAYIVSNAHFDSQWNWDVQTSIKSYIPKTLNTNLMLLEKYPNYVFNFEGGIKYYWMKEYYPHEYDMIKKYVKEGRWHITGASWDANDPNIPSPESFIRNVMYGQHFYRNEFGVLSTDIFLPDCFGFGWTLPTIANHCGLIGFSTQKLQWRNHPFYKTGKKIPFEIGLWQGVDGARIMCVADAHNYTTKWKDGEDLSNSKSLMGFIKNNDGLNTVYHYYGTGDTGGSPTIASVRAVEAGVNGNGPIEIISATSDQLYKDYMPYENHPELPVFDGELLMDVHGTGCYTSQAAMKWYNRRNEQMATAAENAAVVADWFGAVEYPTEMLGEAWKRFVWHQFHDDLTGTSLPRAYEFSWNDELISLKQFADVLTTSVGAVSRKMNTQVSGIPVVLYNAAAYQVADMVEIIIDSAKPIKGVKVYDENGRKVKAQMVSAEGNKAKVLISANVPAMGYVVYDVRPSYGKAKALSVDANTLENSVYKLTLDANGDICSLIDKRNGKQLVADGKAFRLALFTSNMSTAWPAWEIMRGEIEKTPQSIPGAKITMVENGELRKTLKVERAFGAGNSTIVQYISLNEGGQADRVDVYNEVDWKETNSLLKVEFPMSYSNAKATYDLGIGAIERGNNTDQAYEVISQQWTDLTAADGSYGMSVLNDGKYGWDKPNDNTIRLTLLHTPGTKGNYAYQSKQDQGKHHFTYSLVAHSGSYQQAGVVAKAEILNQSIKGFVAPKHKGELGKKYSFVSGDNENVILKALKKAEDGSGDYIVRFFETSGKGAQKANFTFPVAIESASEVNGIEDKIGEANISGKNLNVEIGKYGIKTFRVRLANAPTSISPINQAEVVLPYNTQVASYNAFRRNANFDGRGNSYPAELFPAEVVYKGVKFNLAEADENNGVKCESQEVEIPAGYNKLYLLAASTSRDSKTQFTFKGGKNGEETKEVMVPSYSEFVGQWGHYGHTEGYLKPVDVAYVGTHRHNMLKGDLHYEFAYMFMIPVDVPAGATKVQLPQNPQIAIFAATVANDDNAILPATDLLDVDLPEKEVSNEVVTRKNFLVGKSCIERTGEVNRREKAEFAVDGNPETKWCDVGSDQRLKYVAYDLGEVMTIKGWSVLHASFESLDYTTKEFSLQVKENEGDQWRTVDTVHDNTDVETDRTLSEAVKARYVRLYITKPDQSEGFVSRIYEFQVF